MANLTPLYITYAERNALTTLIQCHQHLGLEFIQDASLESLMRRLLGLQLDLKNQAENLEEIVVKTVPALKEVIFHFSVMAKVPAIKTYREVFGVGLKDAKDRIDLAIPSGTGWWQLPLQMTPGEIDRLVTSVRTYDRNSLYVTYP